METIKPGFDDKKVWDQLNENPLGIFQVEGNGYTQLLQKMPIADFSVLVDSNALIRPGTADGQGLQDYVDRATGKKTVEYEHPLLESILSKTKGVILFQESCLQIANVLAGYSLAEADLFRKAISSKKEEMLAKERGKFVDGCQKTNNITEKVATSIFNQIVTFAGYAFNKSHSVCYSLISYWTAYLKAHYPIEYMTSLLSSQKMEDDVRTYIRHAKDLGLQVGPPNINHSASNFSIPKNQEKLIVFGLAKIKGIGKGVSDHILSKRPYKDFVDFVNKVDKQIVDSRSMELLVKAGCFQMEDKTVTTKQLLENMHAVLAPFKNKKYISPPSVARRILQVWALQKEKRNEPMEYSLLELAHMERKTIGFFISTHPMRHIKDQTVLKKSKYAHLGVLYQAGREFFTMGVLTEKVKVRKSRRGIVFHEIEIEDQDHLLKIPIFGDKHNEVLQTLKAGDVIAVRMNNSKGRLYVQQIKVVEVEV